MGGGNFPELEAVVEKKGCEQRELDSKEARDREANKDKTDIPSTYCLAPPTISKLVSQ